MKISHDFHNHTPLSLCCKDPNATAENYVTLAKKTGITKIGISNHFWDEAIPGAPGFYIPQGFVHVASVREELAKIHDPEVKVYFGCEVEFDIARRDLAVTEEHAAQFDYMLVPNSHTHIIMPKDLYEPKEKHARFMLDVFMDTVNSQLKKYVTAIAHPFNAVACPYDNRELYGMITYEQYREAFLAAKEADIAIEINVSCYKGFTLAEILEHPSIDMFRLAKECGCRFLFGSDAHTVAPEGPHAMWPVQYVIAEQIGLTEEDIAPIAR